jgi:hypothetical protein
MRTLNFLAVTFFAVMTSVGSFAGNIKVPEQHFYLEIKSLHGSSEWFKVYQRGKEWICQTESNPFFKAKDNPLAHLDWNALSGQAAASDCKFKVHIRDSRTSPVRDVEGCVRKSEALHQLIEDLNSSCRAG